MLSDKQKNIAFGLLDIGMKKAQIAKELGISRQTVYRLVAERKSPSILPASEASKKKTFEELLGVKVTDEEFKDLLESMKKGKSVLNNDEGYLSICIKLIE